jgi:hypothetical protein
MTSLEIITISYFKGDYKTFTPERDICRFLEKDFFYPMAYILSYYLAYGFELHIALVLGDFDFDMTISTFRDVTIPISIPIASIAITISSITY